MADLSLRWEHSIDLAGSTHRFVSIDDPNTIALTTLFDDAQVIEAGDTITVWDSASSPITTPDFLYLEARDGDIDIEFTCTSDSGTRTFCLRCAADTVPLTLASAVSIFGFSDSNVGALTKVRARAVAENADDATLRYAVGEA